MRNNWRFKASVTGMIVGLCCLIATNAFALDLEVYGGKYLNSSNFGLSTSENPQFLAGVKAAESFMWRKLTPYIGLETLMDSRVKDSVGGADGFSPTSIKYVAGAELDIYKGVGLRAEHMCWHNISRSFYGGDTQQYTNVQIFYRFSDILKK